MAGSRTGAQRDDPIFAAITFATSAHAGQYRKGSSIPYILHPLRVAKILIEHGCAQELVLAGVLHDTVEDTDATIEEIRARFGGTVAELVAAVTEPDRKAPWEERKRHTIEHMATATEEVLVLAAADKLDNLRTIGEGASRVGAHFWERFNRPRDRQAWYYRSVTAAIARRAVREPLRSLVSDLQETVEVVFGEA